jgi:hypothetical protein
MSTDPTPQDAAPITRSTLRRILVVIAGSLIGVLVAGLIEYWRSGSPLRLVITAGPILFIVGVIVLTFALEHVIARRKAHNRQ